MNSNWITAFAVITCFGLVVLSSTFFATRSSRIAERQAELYRECLATAERIANLANKEEGGVRIVSLPTCTLPR